MSVNFFDTRCQELPISAPNFGICDDRDGSNAYIDTQSATKWVAIVENPQAKMITLTAIDGCEHIKIKREDGSFERRCDALLTYTENIVFVELKEVSKQWKFDAIEQLETTIQVFRANHDLSLFKHKRAFVCNKKHPKFQVIDSETKRRFFDTYRVRLNIQSTIKV